MHFNSWEFLALAAVVFSTYYSLSLNRQNWLLLAASYVFYAAWDVRFLALLVATTVLDFVVGLRMAAATSPRARKRWLYLSVIGNLGTLGFFKYFNFFVDSASGALEALGMPASAIRLEIVLPVGISFYTFQSLSYSIDIYRGELAPTRSFRNFALFVAYFPQLVAGPIERARQLLPQIERPRVVSLDFFARGVWLISWGLFKKAVIADNLAIVVDRTFSLNSGASGTEYLIAIYAFAYQIYCDFSGYSDIARGLAALMGIDLMDNFKQPYRARNPREFWQRWHISLSTWLRDYLYIPLGGSRGGLLKTIRALMMTMILGGLWHGAAWTYVAWGTFHGAWLGLHRIWSSSRLTAEALPRLPAFAERFATFHLVCFGWLIFRAESLDQVAHILAQLGGTLTLGALAVKGIAALGLVIALLALVESRPIPRKHWTWSQAGMVGALWVATLLLPPSDGQPFLYFRF